MSADNGRIGKGRPPRGEAPMEERITIRLGVEEKVLFIEAANMEGTTPGAWLRQIGLDALRDLGTASSGARRAHRKPAPPRGGPSDPGRG